MKKAMIIGIWILGCILLVSNLAVADYFYTPMNFDSPTNHSFDISLDGFIEITLPNNFTLISGVLSGNNNLSFIVESPNLNTTSPQHFVGTINLNGTLYDNFYFLSVADNKIVDAKVEIGHGDFNYIDPEGYIGTDNTLLFNLVRVWAMGSDIIGEPARDIRFNCTYPLIIPNTVDSKYDTTYNFDNITAYGDLSRMEGISMFRVFVLSQEVDYGLGEIYDISCDKIFYSFSHTEVIADIEDINLEARSLEPLVIDMDNNEEYITYTFMNDEVYDIRNIEFLWTIGTHTSREELNSLGAGESVQYNIRVNESGNVDLQARFIPEWMFNSRSPVYYIQTQFDSYYAPSFLDSLDSSNYYNLQTIDTTPILETQVMDFGINILQEAPFGGAYRVTYLFYDEDGVLQDEVERQIIGVTDHTISFSSLDLEPSGLQEDYNVYTIVSFRDENGDWLEFLPEENIGIQTIATLTDNGPQSQVGYYDVIVTSSYDRYESDDKITADIIIKNTGDLPDEDTVLTYYLIGPDGEKFGETKEQILEVPPGSTTFKRSITLPLGSNIGEWEFHVDYETVVQPTIQVYDSFEVVPELSGSERRWTFDGMIWYLIWGFIILIILFITIGRRKRKKI